MDRLVKLLLCFFLLPLSISAQDGAGMLGLVASFAQQPGSKDEGLVRISYEFTQTDEKGRCRTDTMYLDLGLNRSVFYSKDKDRRNQLYTERHDKMKWIFGGNSYEKLIARLEKNNTSDIRIPGNDDPTFYIYKDRRLSEVTTVDELDPIPRFRAIFRENLPPLPWEMQEGKEEILDYLCEKATVSFRGRDYTAWYAIRVPIDDGPWKFYGLPGLILDIKSDDGQISFHAIGIERGRKDNLDVPDDSEFEKIKTLKEMVLYQKESARQNAFFEVFDSSNGAAYTFKDINAWHPVQIEKEF